MTRSHPSTATEDPPARPRAPKRARAARSAFAALVLAAPLGGAACSSELLRPSDSDCPAPRKTDRGGCCDTWQRWQAADGCRERVTSATLDVDVDAAASLVVAAVDGRGQIGVVATTTAALGLYELGASGAFERIAGVGARDALQLSEPDLALGSDGEGLLVYRAVGWDPTRPDADGIFVARRDPSGAWQDSGGPWSTSDSSYAPRVAIGSSGDALVTWNQWYGNNRGVVIATARSAGAAFTLPAAPDDVLSPAVAFSNAPMPAMSADGSFVITWYQAADGPLMVYASERFGRDAEPSRPAPSEHLSAPGAPVDSHPIANPKVALRDDGQAAVAWTQEDGAGSVRAYVATRDATGQWYRPRDLGDALSPPGHARGAQLAFGRAGDLWITWQQSDDRGNRVVLARRDQDGAWTARAEDLVEVSTPGAEGIEPRLVAGRAGGVVLAFLERPPGQSFRVAMRRAASGSPELMPTELLSSPELDASPPALAIGGAELDRVVVAWSERGALRAATID